MSTTRVTRHIDAPRADVYRALIDRNAVQRWMVPDGMTSFVHEFDPRVGGTFRISLTYDAPTTAGKSDPQTDTYHGRFVEFVRDTRVVQVVEFETADPDLQGESTITITLDDGDGGGTLVVGLHENVPSVIPAEDNELGWRMSFDKLARLVEAA
jgi:uncharacterized protein YndB with AHSA1/START domain